MGTLDDTPIGNPREVRRYWLLLLAVGLVPLAMWGLLLLFIPAGEQQFPLHDDCYFGRTAFDFAHGEGLHYFHWSALPLLGQVLWAWPFIAVFGACHVALRISTLVLAGIGAAAFVDLLHTQGKWPACRAALAALCLVVNPWFFLLSLSFHTDVPVLGVSLAGMALYARGVSRQRLAWWMGGMAAAMVAVVTRQNAVALPLAAGFVLLAHRELRRRPAWWSGVVLPTLAGYLVDRWFQGRTDVSVAHPNFTSLLQSPIIALIALHFVGLSSLPLLARARCPSRRGFWILILLGGGWYIWQWFENHYDWQSLPLFPYLGNWVTPFGQFDVNDVQPGNARPLVLGMTARGVLSVLGGLAALRLLAGVRVRGGRPLALLAWFSLIQFGLLSVAPWILDRYLLVLLPGGLALAGDGDAGTTSWGRWRSLAGLTTLVVLAGLTLALAHDLLEWNRAVWALGRRAVTRGIAVEDIEGGFTWDGSFVPAAIPPEGGSLPPRGLTMGFARNFYPSITGRYAISFTPLDQSEVRDVEPYSLWLVPGEREMLFVEEVKKP